MGLPLSSWPFVKIATEDQWEFWQEKSHQRLAFCLKKKKKRPCLCRKFLLFPLCGVWGRVGRGRLPSISVGHCNLKWVMKNINENVNLWERGQQILFPLRSSFLWQNLTKPKPGPFPIDILQLTQKLRVKTEKRQTQERGPVVWEIPG